LSKKFTKWKYWPLFCVILAIPLFWQCKCYWPRCDSSLPIISIPTGPASHFWSIFCTHGARVCCPGPLIDWGGEELQSDIDAMITILLCQRLSQFPVTQSCPQCLPNRNIIATKFRIELSCHKYLQR
jgi:hypothetical protein